MMANFLALGGHGNSELIILKWAAYTGDSVASWVPPLVSEIVPPRQKEQTENGRGAGA